MSTDRFIHRHIGTGENDNEKLCATIGVKSVEELLEKTIPARIRLREPLSLPPAQTEYRYLEHLRELAHMNQPFKSYIGAGYYNTIVPPVIQRNLLENPGWYTAYTPYQAEIAQGRLEALLNFQTVVMELTGMEIANASLLDEATAAAEAMALLFAVRTRQQVAHAAQTFFASEHCHPQTIDVLKTRATPLGIEIVVGNHAEFHFSGKIFGALIQYPATHGEVVHYDEFVKNVHELDIRVMVAADLLALTLLRAPGTWGADVVVGNSQRFGVPMGYGGPHAAFFATREEYKRHLPGRIIGVSKDRHGNTALRMALQTREQHIRRDKATSNICTAQALLAAMASSYAVYHGPEGLKAIARNIHQLTTALANALLQLGYTVENKHWFDTLQIGIPDEVSSIHLRSVFEEAQVNLRFFSHSLVGISLDETVDFEECSRLVALFAQAVGRAVPALDSAIDANLDADFLRTDNFLTHPTFNSYHSETEMMRYLKRLENKDLSLVHSMISLGSCTMKLNSASELMPITWPEFAHIHPFAPLRQTLGYQQMFDELERMLCEITGFDGVSLQPNSGAQGEYAGLMVIRNYHHSRGESHRNVALIPSSAHGTNPASAVMAGMKVVVVRCDENGNIDVDDLRAKAEENSANLGALMVTYPSTHGVFEEAILEITQIVHEHGGQVYMDGANMNAQVGLTNPGNIGADVCHLNLHKTFAIPHGGGGPGMGPIGVKKHLVPFLPGHSVVNRNGMQSGHAVSAAPWGSALILLISYGYIKMLGAEGITESTRKAIAHANYIKARLNGHYDVLYTGKDGTVAHEMILDCRKFKQSANIEVEDIAKRLMDYGFHAPTVSFPVAGTIMIEPTESESLAELDRFCEAMIAIREEIAEIEKGLSDASDNVLKQAPHTVDEVTADEWKHSYSRAKAAFPLSYVRGNKFWPAVGRIDSAYGDRNLVCSCLPIEAYTGSELATA